MSEYRIVFALTSLHLTSYKYPESFNSSILATFLEERKHENYRFPVYNQDALFEMESEHITRRMKCKYEFFATAYATLYTLPLKKDYGLQK